MLTVWVSIDAHAFFQLGGFELLHPSQQLQVQITAFCTDIHTTYQQLLMYSLADKWRLRPDRIVATWLVEAIKWAVSIIPFFGKLKNVEN